MTGALFIDIPNTITINSKSNFPIHREDWKLKKEIKDIIVKYKKLNFKICLIGNFVNIPIRKNDSNPIVSLLENIANSLEKELDIPANSIVFDYTTEADSFEHLPLPGLFYNIASEHEIFLTYSYVITVPTLGVFIQSYSSVKPIIL